MRFRNRIADPAAHKAPTMLAARAEFALIAWWDGLTMRQRRAEWEGKTAAEQRVIRDAFGTRGCGEVNVGR